MAGTRALCVTGMPGCGKEEFLQVAEQAGFAVIRMGDLIREEGARRGLAASDTTLGGMADEERKRHGPEIWAQRTVDQIASNRIVIDGLRSLSELSVFRRAFPEGLSVVAVFASPDTRAQRIFRRGRADDVLTQEELRIRDERELRWGLGDVIAMADYLIVNEGTLADLQKAAKRVLREVFG